MRQETSKQIFISDRDRGHYGRGTQESVAALLPEASRIRKLNRSTFDRAAELERLGFKPADAVHVAAAERSKADVFISCDDRLYRRAKRRRRDLLVEVANPVDWLREIEDADT